MRQTTDSRPWRPLTPLAFVAFAAAMLPQTPAWAYDVSGTVLDSNNQPIPDATVWLSHDRAIRTSQTGAEGRFHFDNVDVGPIEVVARKEGYALGGFDGEVIGSADVSIILAEPDSIRIRVVNTKFEALEGARVKSMVVGGAFHVAVEDLTPHGFPSARSGPEGFLTIGELPKNSSTSFTISHRSYAQATIPTLPVGVDLDVPLPVGIKLRGRITNTRGEGVPRTRVSVYRLRDGIQHEFAETLTGPEGFYTAIVPPAPYFVAARHLDYAVPYPRSIQLDLDFTEPVLDLVLPPPHRLHGTTVDPKGGPVLGVKVSYIARGITFAEVFSDTEGRFAITVAGGQGLLRVSPPDRMVTEAFPDIPLEVESQGEIRLDPIIVKPLPEIVGKVTVKGDAQLDKVLISTLNIDPPLWAVTGPEGDFRIQLGRMPQGAKVRLRAEHALRFLRRDIEVSLTNLKPVEIRLKPFKPDLSPAPDWTPNNLAGMVGEPAPELRCDAWFNVVPNDGEEASLSLQDLQGKVVVLTLWGGFDDTGPGRHRMDQLGAIHLLLRELDDVAIIAVHDAGKKPHEVAQYIRTFAIQFPIGCDADPALTFDAYNTNFIPETVIIDKKGILRHYHVGGNLLELIKDLRRRA